ncbi:short-chain dehydrogenase, partial [Mesorhizobium sp. M2D.F.Ca.ET.140.01.1.1]
AVMTRATLGHTGRDLQANVGTRVVFVAIVLAAVMRIGAAFLPAQAMLLHISAMLWVAAFLGYAALFGGMLVQPKLRARQPNKAPS